MSTAPPVDVITGAFGYTGAQIARGLIAAGRNVRTLTNHPKPDDAASQSIQVAPLSFDNPAELQRSLEGAEVLYNTYWIRFPHGNKTFEQAVENSRTLFQAAKLAGAQRIVHASIANPSEDSPLGYYHGKAQVERALRECGVSYAVLRPTVLFGTGDILINNIAWLLRHFPIFAVPDIGDCSMQPGHVEDLADLAVARGSRRDCTVDDAVGAEAYTFEEIVREIAKAVGSHAKIIRVGKRTLAPMLRVLGWVTGDVVLTDEELDGLAANLLLSKRPALCPTSFSKWLSDNSSQVGRKYASEIRRHY
jgi:NADH dehydrogenase